MRWSAIVVAAGRGTRFGRPKQFVELAGQPMVAWSLRTLGAVDDVTHVIVVTESEWIDSMRELAGSVLGSRVSSVVVSGGATRQGSVAKGLRALPASCEAVLVHDGARPLVDASDVRTGMREVRPGRAAVLAAPVVDTIKIVNRGTMLVEQTLDRATLWAAQTPQLAMRSDLERAHAQAECGGTVATDDVALLEAIGIEVVVVPSSSENFKVTHAHDVLRAEVLLRERSHR